MGPNYTEVGVAVQNRLSQLNRPLPVWLLASSLQSKHPRISFLSYQTTAANAKTANIAQKVSAWVLIVALALI